MKKVLASIKKEWLILWNDKVGLLLMYGMPILLVFIITLVQDSTFKLVNENKIELLIVNQDEGSQGDSLVQSLKRSGAFNIEESDNMSDSDIQSTLLDGDELVALKIPASFSFDLQQKAKHISSGILNEFDLADKDTTNLSAPNSIKFFYDPVLQNNFRFSLVNSVYAQLSILENTLMIEQLYVEMGVEEIPQDMKAQFDHNRVNIEQVSANKSSGEVIPNSTQHNVPAWSIFAMFFMVISLGGNIVKERLSGSFVRLQTIPSSFSLVLLSKTIIYLLVALSQLVVIFAIGKYIFPSIGLPALVFPSNLLGLIVVSVLSALAAISFAMLVGTYAKTQEQANGFGAITVIILAAIGGIWVPSFVMPSYLQNVGMISPLHWCIEGYYTLFLKGGDWYLLLPTLLFLIIFILACQILVYIKLRIQNYI